MLHHFIISLYTHCTDLHVSVPDCIDQKPLGNKGL